MVEVGERGAAAARVVHVRRDPYDVYVGRGRGSTWGNPFRIGDPHPATGKPLERGEAIALHEEWMLVGDGCRLLEKRLKELDDRVLGCWCAPAGGVGVHDPLICHGQVLLRLLARRTRTGDERAPRRRFVFSGSRGWFHREPVRRALRSLPEGAVVVTGGARGLDAVAELEASRLGFEVEVFEADWDRFGRSAGHRRNEEMISLPGVEALNAFRSRGRSPGTDGAVRLAKAADIGGRLVRER